MKVPKQNQRNILTTPLDLPIKLQLMLIYGALIGGLTIFICLLINIEINTTNQYQTDTVGKVLSAQTASAAANIIVTGDSLSLSSLLNQLVQNPHVSKASIYSIDNRRLGHAQAENAENRDNDPVYSSPINYQDVIAGYARISLNQELLNKKPKRSINIILATSSLLFVIGLVILFFYGGYITKKLSLIERQILCISPLQYADITQREEINRISAIVEHQLIEKNKEDRKNKMHITEEIVAIISVRSKNISRLQKLLAPQDLMSIIRLHMDIITEAANFYEGGLSYSPEGHVYIRFSSKENEDFVINALYCGLLIEELSQRAKTYSIAKIQTGIGLSISDKIPEQPNDQHPTLRASAASQALMLASLPESDGLHMLRKQMSWLPAYITDISVSEKDNDILIINSISILASDNMKRQAKLIEENLMS